MVPIGQDATMIIMDRDFVYLIMGGLNVEEREAIYCAVDQGRIAIGRFRIELSLIYRPFTQGCFMRFPRDFLRTDDVNCGVLLT